TNSAKTVLQRSEYEPYGFLANRPMQDGPGDTGHITDAATGLVYMQQRYYDAELGHFPSPDPVTANSPGGTFNRYWYANANPYRFADPDGRQAKRAQNCGDEPCPESRPEEQKPSRREQAAQRHREQLQDLGWSVTSFSIPGSHAGADAA